MVRGCIQVFLALSLAIGNAAWAQTNKPAQTVPEIDALEPELVGLYRDLHQHPELAFHEDRTASVLAERLRALGFDVTTGVGKTGLVAILRTGPPRVVIRRSELQGGCVSM